MILLIPPDIVTDSYFNLNAVNTHNRDHSKLSCNVYGGILGQEGLNVHMPMQRILNRLW